MLSIDGTDIIYASHLQTTRLLKGNVMTKFELIQEAYKNAKRGLNDNKSLIATYKTSGRTLPDIFEKQKIAYQNLIEFIESNSLLSKDPSAEDYKTFNTLIKDLYTL
jgi:hypothetical protein